MTAVSEEAREGSALAVPQDPEINAEAGAHARTSIALPCALPSTAVTVRVRQAGVAAAKALALLDRPGTLAHSQPPTFREAHGRHRECADWFRSPVLRRLRMAYGWLHILFVKTVLNGLEWVTESPLRAVSAAALAVAIWFWS